MHMLFDSKKIKYSVGNQTSAIDITIRATMGVFSALFRLSKLDLEVIMLCLVEHQLGGVTGGKAFVILFVHQDLGHYSY